MYTFIAKPSIQCLVGIVMKRLATNLNHIDSLGGKLEGRKRKSGGKVTSLEAEMVSILH